MVQLFGHRSRRLDIVDFLFSFIYFPSPHDAPPLSYRHAMRSSHFCHSRSHHAVSPALTQPRCSPPYQLSVFQQASDLARQHYGHRRGSRIAARRRVVGPLPPAIACRLFDHPPLIITCLNLICPPPIISHCDSQFSASHHHLSYSRLRLEHACTLMSTRSPSIQPVK